MYDLKLLPAVVLYLRWLPGDGNYSAGGEVASIGQYLSRSLVSAAESKADSKDGDVSKFETSLAYPIGEKLVKDANAKVVSVADAHPIGPGGAVDIASGSKRDSIETSCGEKSLKTVPKWMKISKS